MNNTVKLKYQIAAFYCFTEIGQDIVFSFRDHLLQMAASNNVRGTILLANEGVNGTICGIPEGVALLIEKLKTIVSDNHIEVKISWCDQQAFRRLKVKQKPEIVTMGIEGINPKENVGIYVQPSEWNSFLEDPDTLVIDTRNEYEVGIGSFNGAINPHTNCFRDFPKWVEGYLRPLVEENKPKRIAMYCTGGIRCEKATSYLRQGGFQEVHHLKGGILRYLEEIPQDESLWSGECFVFDRRVALDHNLLQGDYLLCHACGMPLSSHDRDRTSYVKGIQCHYCEHIFTDEDRARFAERQKYYDKCYEKNSEIL